MIMMIRSCFSIITSLCVAALCHAQAFPDLTDAEVSTLVRADQAQELMQLWTLSESGSGRRLRATYFATDLLDEVFFSDLSTWINRQVDVNTSQMLGERIRNAFPKADPDDIRALSKLLIVLARDPSRHVIPRVAAALTITAFDTREFHECVILVALALRHELQHSIRPRSVADWDLVVRIMKSSDDTIVFANLLQLWRLLRSQDTTDENIREAFSALRHGQFIPPFLVEEGNRDQNRLVIVKPRFYQRPDLEHLTRELQIETTDFSILEGFRSQEFNTFPRNQRQAIFNETFGAIKARISNKALKQKQAYLESIADDIALLCSRMLQCDTEEEILSAGVHLTDCERSADIEERLDSPIVVPRELRDSTCFAILTPEYYFGKRSADFYAKCTLAASLGKKWELSILSRNTVHPKNDTTSDNDSSPER
ncbi:MAG: hypothetical protein ACK6A7_20115 [Planctomycetota bacterium]